MSKINGTTGYRRAYEMLKKSFALQSEGMQHEINAVRNQRDGLASTLIDVQKECNDWREKAKQWEIRAGQWRDEALELRENRDNNYAALASETRKKEQAEAERDDARKECERIAALNRGLLQSEANLQDLLKLTRTELLYYVELTRRIVSLNG